MKKTIAIFITLLILVIMLLPNSSKAEPGGALVKISTDNETVEIGDTVKITVSQYDGGTVAKKTKYVEFKLNYDNEIFSYEGTEAGYNDTDLDGTISVATESPHLSDDISSVTFTFKAIKSTTNGKGATFKVSEFKSGDSSISTLKGNYSVMQINVNVKERYEGTVDIQADKTSVPVERKVNISLAQTIGTNYVEATISYDKTHFEFIAPANSEYEADDSTDGQITVKAFGTEIKDVTLLFKAIAETEANSPSKFRIINYKAGDSSEDPLNAHLYYAKEVGVIATARNQSTVQIATDLTDNIATLGSTFMVTISQDKPTDYVQFDLFYNKEMLSYVGLGENDAEITATENDEMLSVTATGNQISEINLKFQPIKLTEEDNKETMKVSNFLAGDNSGDTDIALYSIQQVEIQIVNAPIVNEPEEPDDQNKPAEEPEKPTDEPKEPENEPAPADKPSEETKQPEQPVNELPSTGSILTTFLAIVVAGITIIAIAIKKYRNSKNS